ncbi:MAG: ThuA domain-containing protein [Oscillospiraceae bacterium]|jgi:hypothetical protein|nr:ThuA domain-containing protein [Oscillospiraceae bacterium]
MSLRATIFASPMGHDVNRISQVLAGWLRASGLFEPTVAGTPPEAAMSIGAFMKQPALVADTSLFIFVCPDDAWCDPADRRALEAAVAGGTPVLFWHGLHPTYRDWPEAEKMIGLLWRQTASHGDFNTCRVSIQEKHHPITAGVPDFDTEDELFCTLENVRDVPVTVLATAYSDAGRKSRWGHPGTGAHEPVLTAGRYGKARTVNFILGHIWTHYTGHGLMENTTIALQPPQIRTLFLRSCEWAVRGDVIDTRDM